MRLECLLEKKNRELRLDDLRTIVLLEADYNQCVKLIFGKCIKYPESQYGTKRGTRAIEAVRLKRMSLEMIRLNRQPAVFMTTDLHSCYDRIVHTVASLSSQKYGIQPEPIKMLIYSIQHSTSNIRTGLGDSERTYSSDPDDPFHGTGQGSGASPAARFVITIVLIEALLDTCIGTFITLAISLQLLRFPATLFVDDTDFLITGSTDNEDSASILLESQRSVLL